MELITLFSNPNIITAGRKRPFEVFRFFDKMRRLYSSKTEAKGCKITLKSPFSSAVQVYDSFALIPHILIDNAVKYSEKNENITVSFEDLTNKVIIKVKSIGPLISLDEKERIFEKFYKGKQSQLYTSEGSGIGLYVAKEIVEKHGGRILVDSIPFNRNANSYVENIFTIEIPKL